jgi:hypothetical protein
VSERRFPVLEGWVTATDIAEDFGISRQSVNRMIGRGDFDTVREVGQDTKRAIFVVSAAEVKERKAARAAKTI